MEMSTQKEPIDETIEYAFLDPANLAELDEEGLIKMPFGVKCILTFDRQQGMVVSTTFVNPFNKSMRIVEEKRNGKRIQYEIPNDWN